MPMTHEGNLPHSPCITGGKAFRLIAPLPHEQGSCPQSLEMQWIASRALAAHSLNVF